MADGKAFLVDGDAGRMLGMLSTGFAFGGVVLPRNRSQILSPETYFSRGTRGTRTDVVTFYDPRKLSPTGEVADRAQARERDADARAIRSDGRRSLPVHLQLHAARSRSPSSTCRTRRPSARSTAAAARSSTRPDRAVLLAVRRWQRAHVQLDDAGAAANRLAARIPLFDPVKDPVTEKGVRVGNTWLFATFSGEMVPIETTAPTARVLAQKWSLLDDAAKAEQWRPGGMQHLTVHVATQAALQPDARRRRRHPQGPRHRGLGLRPGDAQTRAAHQARGSRDLDRDHAGRRAVAVRDLHRRGEGRRLRSEVRQAAARRQGNRPDAHDARAPTESTCADHRPRCFLDRVALALALLFATRGAAQASRLVAFQRHRSPTTGCCRRRSRAGRRADRRARGRHGRRCSLAPALRPLGASAGRHVAGRVCGRRSRSICGAAARRSIAVASARANAGASTRSMVVRNLLLASLDAARRRAADRAWISRRSTC